MFWRWAIALLGMCTSLFECSLAQVYKRSQPDGTYRGGSARYIIHGLVDGFRWLAIHYAVCLIAAFAFGFNAFQGNTAAGAAEDSPGVIYDIFANAFRIEEAVGGGLGRPSRRGCAGVSSRTRRGWGPRSTWRRSPICATPSAWGSCSRCRCSSTRSSSARARPS